MEYVLISIVYYNLFYVAKVVEIQWQNVFNVNTYEVIGPQY